MSRKCLRFRGFGLTILLTLALVASCMPVVKAQPAEIAYDDGSCEQGIGSTFIQWAVNFSLPEGWSMAKLLKARFFIHSTRGANWTVYVYNRSRIEVASLEVTPPSGSDYWYDADLSSLNIIINGDFYISIMTISSPPYPSQMLGIDGNATAQRSFTYNPNTNVWNPSNDIYMIRAVVENLFREPTWNTSDEVYDLGISADGSIVAAVVHANNDDELRVYDDNGNLLWNWSQQTYEYTVDNQKYMVTVRILAVDISDNGNALVASISNRTDIYIWGDEDWDYYTTESHDYLLFWESVKSLSGINPPYKWRSVDLGGGVGPEALAISSDGNQVVAVGTGTSVYYWNNSLTLSGEDISTTWNDTLIYELSHVDISDDGDTISILGGSFPKIPNPSNIAILVYKNCRSRIGQQSQSYNLSYIKTLEGGPIRCMALADNGLYMVAGLSNHTGGGEIYLFNTTMFEAWAPQWTYTLNGDEWVAAVDISSDGNTGVAVTNRLAASPSGLLIFRDSASKIGEVTSADAEFTMAVDYTNYNYSDVSVDGSGSIAAGGTGDYVFAVNATTGEPLWYYNGTWPLVSMFVRVSEDGTAVVSAGSGIDSLYYFGPETAEVTFDQHGVASDFTGPVLKVDGADYTAAMLPKSFTWIIGSNHTFEFYTPLNVGTDKRYAWTGTQGLSTDRTGEITIPIGGGAVNATYKTQYQITFDHTGLDGTAVGPVVTVDGSPKMIGDLPFSKWVDNGTTVSHSYHSPVSSNTPGKRFSLVSVTHPSPLTITAPTTVKGNYKTQYLITVTSSPPETLGGGFMITYTSCGATYTEWKETPWTEWVDAGTTVTVSEPQPYVQNYQFKGYSPSNSVYMNASKTITLIYIQLPVGGVITPTEVLATPLVSLSALIAAAALLAIAAKRKST